MWPYCGLPMVVRVVVHRSKSNYAGIVGSVTVVLAICLAFAPFRATSTCASSHRGIGNFRGVTVRNCGTVRPRILDGIASDRVASSCKDGRGCERHSPEYM